MKKLSILIFMALITTGITYGQEKIFSLGYGKTFVKSDSATINITFDLNRIPGQNEKAGGYFFINENIRTSNWGYYLKPTMDVNIGSGITSAPNNISVGLPIGLVYDFPKNNLGIFSLYIEGSPDLVADKTFTNNLYYFSINTYLKYAYLDDNIQLDIIAGLSDANGIRAQYLSEENIRDNYGRITIPLYTKLVAWKASTVNGKDFKRISWVNSFKYNHIYSDNKIINKKHNYSYFNSKLDFYITPNVGINITYNNGNEEPIFKRNNSISLGLTLAR